MRGVLQADLRQEALGRIEAATEDVRHSLTGLTDDQLGWKPSPERWSVAECLAHLVVTHDAYRPNIQAATASTAPRAPEGNRVVSTWIGALLFKSVDPQTPRKIKTPTVFKPGRSEVPGSPVEAFGRCHDSLRLLIESTAELDWHRIKVVSPASRLLRFRLGDVYRVLTAHAQRHVNQAIRVTEIEGF